MRRSDIIIRNAAAHLRKQFREVVRGAVALSSAEAPSNFTTCIDTFCYRLQQQVIAECDRIKRQSSNYEPLFSMPPSRRKAVATAKPVTLVERRAIAAKRKVIEWQRKQKLAATKIKQYRKKVSYYTKKGVIQ